MITVLLPFFTKMFKIFCVFLCFCLSATTRHIMVEASLSVTEVYAGELAELPCLSSDDFHRFMFWQLTDDRYIIGPGNPLDEQKYDYEVLTGKLYIRDVSSAEAGFYKCISKSLNGNSAFNVHIVELIVNKDYGSLAESTFEKNLLRGMAVTMVLVVGIAVILLVVMMRRRKSHRFFDAMEESRENSPAKYVGTIQSVPVTSSSTILESRGINNLGLDVDFPKVFQQLQNKPLP